MTEQPQRLASTEMVRGDTTTVVRSDGWTMIRGDDSLRSAAKSIGVHVAAPWRATGTPVDITALVVSSATEDGVGTVTVSVEIDGTAEKSGRKVEVLRLPAAPSQAHAQLVDVLGSGAES